MTRAVDNVNAGALCGSASLERFNQATIREASLWLGGLIDAFADELAERRPSPGQFEKHREQAGIIRQQRRSLLSAAETQLADLEPREESSPPPPGNGEPLDTGTLDLIDIQEFEDQLAIERATRLTEGRFKADLAAIRRGVDVWLDGGAPAYPLPIAARQLCGALRAAFSVDKSLRSLFPDCCRFMTDYAEQTLGPLYARLKGLLPDAPYRADDEASGTETTGLERSNTAGATRGRIRRAAVESNRESTLHTGRGDHPLAGPPHTTACPAHAAAADLYQAVMASAIPAPDQRGTQSPVVGVAGGATEAGACKLPAPAMDARAITKLLQEWQQDQDTWRTLTASPSLAGRLDDALAQAPGNSGDLRIDEQHRRQIGIIDRLFANLQTKLDIHPQLRPVLAALQIPLARVAIAEPDFFLQREHPARQLVEILSRLAIAANFPNQSLQRRLQSLVARIVDAYESDAGVFAEARDEARTLLDQQQRAVARNTQWLLRTLEGRQKLASARAAVDRALADTLPAKAVPTIILDFLEAGWRDLMALTHVRHGADSENWTEAVAVIAQLAQWLDRSPVPAADGRPVERELEVDNFIELIEHMLDTAVAAGPRADEILARLRPMLTGRGRIEDTADTAPTVDLPASRTIPRSRLSSLPRLRRWLHRVDQLEPGTRLCCRSQSGRERVMTLVWVSDDREQLVFADERGRKTAELSRIACARRLARGMHSPHRADGLPPIDRSLYDTLEEVQREISRDTYRDSLTGLLNRKGLEVQLLQAMAHARTRGAEHCLVTLEADHLDIASELFSGDGADQIIQHLAALLEHEAASQDWCARLGKGRFALVIFNRDPARASQDTEALHTLIASRPVEVDGAPVVLSARLGIATIDSNSRDAAALLSTAEAALEKTRAGTAGGPAVTDPSLSAESSRPDVRQSGKQPDTDRAQFQVRIDQLMAANRLALRGQPIASATEPEAPPHYEILIGLLDEQGQIGSPQELILEAERHGYMTVIDRWVVERTFDWIDSLTREARPMPQLSINISGNSVTDDLFLEFLLSQISTRGIPTTQLCFEITETGTISNMIKAGDFVRTLRSAGCSCSIDDFGTGMASYNYLRELPVDYVKIDGRFIRNINSDPRDHEMVRSINSLAKFLGQATIAECVEDEATAATLRGLGIDYLQGWSIGKPQSLDTIAEAMA